MIDNRFPPPAIHHSITRMQCSKCGAEANAPCNCGVHYIPVQQRVAEYDQDNPGKSSRQVAADLDVDQSTVVRARRDADASPDTVTGSDGKQYPARQYRRPSAPTPVRQDLIDQAMALIQAMREADYDTWKSFDRTYQKARDAAAKRDQILS